MNINENNINNLVLGHGIVEESSKIECWRLRGFFYIGAYSHLGSGSNAWNVIIGRYTRIDTNVHLGFRIAYDRVFSNHYFAYSEGYLNEHDYNSFKAERFFYDKQNMTFIGNDVRIHQGGIVCCGVTIGDGAIVYPNSFVDSDVPPYAIVAGNPAKIIRYRFPASIISDILDTDWYNRDLSVLDRGNDYSDIRTILVQLANREDIKKEYKKYYINSFLKNITEYRYKRLVIGPSHIDIWQSKVNAGERAQPNFLMYGVNGLSLYSSKLKRLIDWFIENDYGDVVLFVPDFRIGNVILNGNDVGSDPLFISKSIIDSESDEILLRKALTVLDRLVFRYEDKIKFVFWCLMGRESENKLKGKYCSDGVYHHPTWNYSDIKERYCNNIINIPGVEDSISEYVHDNSTIHPTNKGYDFLEKYISLDE